MKAILSAALVVGLCGLAIAQGGNANPVGTWNCEYKIGDQMRTLDMTIEKDGDKLTGTMNWPDQKGEKVKVLKLKASTLTFSAVRKFMGQEFPLDFTLTIEADTFKGKPRRNSGAISRSSESRESGRRRASSVWAVLKSGRGTTFQRRSCCAIAQRRRSPKSCARAAGW